MSVKESFVSTCLMELSTESEVEELLLPQVDLEEPIRVVLLHTLALEMEVE